MKNIKYRLHFIDAMRAWAILMMLQGHFIDALLEPIYKDTSLWSYSIWSYFRGITAPVFFTASGFIFTYLLVKDKASGFKNPRVKKGIRRGVQLLIIGYLLRTNIASLLMGDIYNSFFFVDVLHCIGLSILGIIGVYLLTSKAKPIVFACILVLITLILFLFEPTYEKWTFAYLPNAIANYFTKANGSVFTIIPWFGYATFGGFMAVLFTKYKNYKHLYATAIISCATIGLLLIFYSSKLFYTIDEITDTGFLEGVYTNNYLFIRLGDVFLVFAVFMLFRQYLAHKFIFKIGQNTLPIYVIHFVILYGSLTGLGLYQFFNHSLSPIAVILGAVLFMVACTGLALVYDNNERKIKATINKLKQNIVNLFK